MNIDYFVNNSEWDVAVIIPTLNRTDCLYNVLQSFYQQTILPKEIMVIDQSDLADINLEMLKEFDNKVELSYYYLDVCSKKCALNWGLRLSKSPIILIVDDDVEFNDQLVFNHLLALHEHGVDNINGASAKPDKKLLSESRVPGRWEDGVTTLTHNRMVDYPCMTLQVNGNNSSFKRNILLEMNGWDENSLIASDDDEMSMKLFNKGGIMMYDPRPKLVHLKAPIGGWRDLWFKKIYTSFIKRQLQYPHSRFIYYYRKYFSTYAAISYIILIVIRGQYNYEIKKVRTFLKTPIRMIAAILNWRLTSKMLKKNELGYYQNTLSKVTILFTTGNDKVDN